MGNEAIAPMNQIDMTKKHIRTDVLFCWINDIDLLEKIKCHHRCAKHSEDDASRPV